ncbi:trehalase family glycosidase [Chitinimonas arctica]|nr:trehalase family glycosidase [Chitinimonas arctica]
MLYHDVELSGLYPDSKAFADMVAIRPPQQIAEEYANRKNTADFELKEFIETHFTPSARQSNHYVPVAKQGITAHIDTLWQFLRRDPGVNTHPCSSLLPLFYPYLVAGGRFDEIYYWDSYFIMLGLVRSDRRDLMKDGLRNIADLIDRYGHVPNGNRSYYLSRSQPPLFAQMVQLAAVYEGDRVYLQYLPALNREYAYWMDGQGLIAPGATWRHLVRLSKGTWLNRHWDDLATPRDESYREDLITAQEAPRRKQEDMWRNLRAAAETGWDFSSRWFADGKTLATIEVVSLIPVDLNCLLADHERTLARAYRLQGDFKQMANFERRAAVRIRAIRRLLWDRQLGAYGDYNFISKRLTHRLSAATVYPLYFGIATKAQARAIASTLRARLLRPGGLATTTVCTGQQWDEPNGWAPLQYLAVMGLAVSGSRPPRGTHFALHSPIAVGL